MWTPAAEGEHSLDYSRKVKETPSSRSLIPYICPVFQPLHADVNCLHLRSVKNHCKVPSFPLEGFCSQAWLWGKKTGRVTMEMQVFFSNLPKNNNLYSICSMCPFEIMITQLTVSPGLKPICCNRYTKKENF